jgi:UDP-N-acetylglucosamine 2-epimerase
VFTIGNTIVEVCKKYAEPLMKTKKRMDCIILDIHRPENFKDRDRMVEILHYAEESGKRFGAPVKFLRFERTLNSIEQFDLLPILNKSEMLEFTPLMSYQDFLEAQYHCIFMISDSGTAQEEPALLNTPVVVPRDFTERPQSYNAACSYKLDLQKITGDQNPWYDSWEYVDSVLDGLVDMDPSWLGGGTTADDIVETLNEAL